MLGSQIKSLVNDKLQQEANEIQRLKEQKDSKTLREIKNVEDLFTYLKAFTKQIADGERKLETDKNGKVFITNTKEIFGRNYYGALFTQNINKNFHNKIIIDKLPLNLIRIKFLHNLFPNTKFIISVRHPLDCILSCFTQNFLLNSAMINFLVCLTCSDGELK